ALGRRKPDARAEVRSCRARCGASDAVRVRTACVSVRKCYKAVATVSETRVVVLRRVRWVGYFGFVSEGPRLNSVRAIRRIASRETGLYHTCADRARRSLIVESSSVRSPVIRATAMF